MNNEIKNEINREIRAFNKTITPSTTNKTIWNKKVELSKKYGLKIIGRYVDESEDKFTKIDTLKKGEESIFLVVAPKVIKLDKEECEIKEVPLMFVGGGKITSNSMTVWSIKNGKKSTKKFGKNKKK